jgi:CRISPR/Cas system-associated protein Csm6
MDLGADDDRSDGDGRCWSMAVADEEEDQGRSAANRRSSQQAQQRVLEEKRRQVEAELQRLDRSVRQSREGFDRDLDLCWRARP